jgi:hypothetical protein
VFQQTIYLVAEDYHIALATNVDDFRLQFATHDDPPRIVRLVQYEELGIVPYGIPQFTSIDLPIILGRTMYFGYPPVPDDPTRRLYRRLIPWREYNGMTTVGRECQRGGLDGDLSPGED